MNESIQTSASALLEARGLQMDESRKVVLGETRATFVASRLNQAGVPAEIQGDALILPPESTELSAGLRAALRPQLVCLDIDGCLIDTEASFDNVVKTLFRRYTGKEVNDDEILAVRKEGGFNDDNVLAYELIKRNGTPVDLDNIFPAFRDLYFGTETEEGYYKKESLIISVELLQDLQDDFPVALVTGRNREETALALELLNLPDTFPMWTVDDVKTGKPDPEGILAAATRFSATDVWMVGDNVDDILAAKRAGAAAIGVGRYREALLEVGADIVLDNINQLEALL